MYMRVKIYTIYCVQEANKVLYVVKRDGREVKFNTDKIGNAIKKASDEVGEQLR